VAAVGQVAAHQPFEDGGQLLAQRLGLEELPIVKGDAVAQRRTFQEIAPIERHRLLQLGQALRADLLRGVAMPAAGLYEAAKVAGIQPEVSVRVGADLLAVYNQPFTAQRLFQERQVAAQHRLGSPGLQLGPQHRHQPFAADRSALSLQAGHRHISAEGQDLARIELQGHAVAFQARRTKQKDRQSGHPHPLSLSMISAIGQNGNCVHNWCA